MRYLTAEEILVIHARIIDETGGSHGLRDVGLLESIVHRPRTSFGGKEMFETLFEKAAVYFESIIQYHVFIDGNKRTAVGASSRSLFINGFNLTASNEEVEKFTIQVATKKTDIKEIAKWFKRNSKKYE